jgi:hypothetical protein
MDNTSKCNRCGRVVFWHTSKAGRKYPCDSDDRRNFHVCTAADPKPPAPKPAPLTPQTVAPKPATPASDVERRLTWLEDQVRGLLLKVDALEFGR